MRVLPPSQVCGETEAVGREVPDEHSIGRLGRPRNRSEQCLINKGADGHTVIGVTCTDAGDLLDSTLVTVFVPGVEPVAEVVAGSVGTAYTIHTPTRSAPRPRPEDDKRVVNSGDSGGFAGSSGSTVYVRRMGITGDGSMEDAFAEFEREAMDQLYEGFSEQLAAIARENGQTNANEIELDLESDDPGFVIDGERVRRRANEILRDGS